LNGKVGIHAWEVGVGGVSMSSTSLTTLVDRVQTSPGTECLEPRRGRVRFLQFVENIFEVGLGLA
jgi:hypothetical protein